MRRRFLVVSTHPEWGTRTDEILADAETRGDVWEVWAAMFPGIARKNEVKSIELKRRPRKPKNVRCARNGCAATVEAERAEIGFTVCGTCAREQDLLPSPRMLGNGKLSADGITVSPAMGGPRHFQPAGKPRIVTREMPVRDDNRMVHRDIGWLDPAPTRELHAVWDYWCVPRDSKPIPPKGQGFATPEDMRVHTKGNIPDQPFDRPRRDNGPHFTARTETEAVRKQRQRERNADHKRRTMAGDRLG